MYFQASWYLLLGSCHRVQDEASRVHKVKYFYLRLGINNLKLHIFKAGCSSFARSRIRYNLSGFICGTLKYELGSLFTTRNMKTVDPNINLCHWLKFYSSIALTLYINCLNIKLIDQLFQWEGNEWGWTGGKNDLTILIQRDSAIYLDLWP
jgi:hypothetical protein